jgi:hypothetical protein
VLIMAPGVAASGPFQRQSIGLVGPLTKAAIGGPSTSQWAAAVAVLIVIATVAAQCYSANGRSNAKDAPPADPATPERPEQAIDTAAWMSPTQHPGRVVDTTTPRRAPQSINGCPGTLSSTPSCTPRTRPTVAVFTDPAFMAPATATVSTPLMVKCRSGSCWRERLSSPQPPFTRALLHNLSVLVLIDLRPIAVQVWRARLEVGALLELVVDVVLHGMAGGKASFPLRTRSSENAWRKSRSRGLSGRSDITQEIPTIPTSAPGVVRHAASPVLKEVTALGAVQAARA